LTAATPETRATRAVAIHAPIHRAIAAVKVTLSLKELHFTQHLPLLLGSVEISVAVIERRASNLFAKSYQTKPPQGVFLRADDKK
jgi:hypothetical protein